MASPFKYTRAVVRGISASLPPRAQRLKKPSEPVNLEIARKQHSCYVETLRKLNLEVTELEADEAFPDCVFVEDTAVVVGNTALITNPGHVSRRAEVIPMKSTLKKLGLDIVTMELPATLDGGDVLFTGCEFFVGISTRTNQEGVLSLAKAFPDFPVSSVKVQHDHLHLTTMMNMGGEGLIIVGGSKEASDAWAELESKAKFKYQKLVVPEDRAANCLYINGTLVHMAAEEIPASIKILQELPGNKMEVPNGELSKVDGCLSCNSILLH